MWCLKIKIYGYHYIHSVCLFSNTAYSIIVTVLNELLLLLLLLLLLQTQVYMLFNIYEHKCSLCDVLLLFPDHYIELLCIISA